MLIKAHTK